MVEGLTTTTYWGSKGGMFGFGKGRKGPKVTPVTLQEQLDALEAQFRSLKLEWTDTYERLYKIAGRLDAAKRWSSEKTPPLPTTEKEIAPDNGSEHAFQTPTESPTPTRAQSRKDLLEQWTR